jgi:hypothetical protein
MENIETIDTNKEIMFTFRFGTSDESVHLNQQQLNSIPYLAALVAHKDDMLSIQNQNGEYVLNPSISYRWFIIILRSITLDQPYILFTDTSEHENILDVLHLYDYLCINILHVPIMKGNQSDPAYDSDDIRIEYRKANHLETLDTAARFIMALNKNKYNLDNCKSIRDIFFLVKCIFSNSSVFNSQFWYHTLTIVKQCCFSSFSQKQQRQLSTRRQILTENVNHSSTYMLYDDQFPSERYQDVFAWRAIYVSTEEKEINTCLNYARHIMYYFQYVTAIIDRYENQIDEIHEKKKDSEAKSARSGRFNTLPKRPNIDKIKHRSGPKAQKYR